MSVKKCPTCQGAMKEDAPECPWCAKGGIPDMGEVERESMLEWPSRGVMMLVGTGLMCFIIAAFKIYRKNR